MAYMTQNGVRTPTTSAGSNQPGDRVTYRAQRISPSGLVWAAAGSATGRTHERSTPARATIRFTFMRSSSAAGAAGAIGSFGLESSSYRVLSGAGKPRGGPQRRIDSLHEETGRCEH